MFALLSPVLLGTAAAAIAYSSLAYRKAALQKAADDAALAAAQQLSLGVFDENRISNTASSVALSVLGGTYLSAQQSVETQVSSDHTKVTVSVTEPVNGPFQNILPLPAAVVAVATAQAVGSEKVCIIGLDGTKGDTVVVRTTATMSATQCSIFSNSTNPSGLETANSGTISANRICSSGGFKGSSGSATPAPTTDCPQIKDPLAKVPQPSVGACDYNNVQYKTGTVVLAPGTYCGGIDINGAVNATFSQGIYTINGGTLHFDGGANVSGDYVSFFLTGDAVANFGPNSTVSLSASKTGALAGFLLFEDRNHKPVTHTIGSNNARKLLGTIYLPESILHVGSTGSVADVSAYTVIVADQLQVDQAANLTLNVNYGATDVPVPDGVGPVGGSTTLVH